MKRKIILLVLALLVILSLGYLLLKPYEYRVRFQAKALPGVVNQTLKIWNSAHQSAEITNQESLGTFTQMITVEDRTYEYDWTIDLINDSTSTVNVKVSQPSRKFLNKLLIPFTATDIERDAEQQVKHFYNKLKEHLQKFKVRVEGVTDFQGSFCVCIPLASDQVSKAGRMMANYSFLSSFIGENEIKPNGMPIVEITNWDINQDQLEFNFCYPIISQEDLPEHKLLKYKQLESRKAIKAIYNGNYITSDRAWYALKNYANKHELDTEDKPIEIFYNNPNFDSNEMDWKAEVFLPLK